MCTCPTRYRLIFTITHIHFYTFSIYTNYLILRSWPFTSFMSIWFSWDSRARRTRSFFWCTAYTFDTISTNIRITRCRLSIAKTVLNCFFCYLVLTDVDVSQKRSIDSKFFFYRNFIETFFYIFYTTSILEMLTRWTAYWSLFLSYFSGVLCSFTMESISV